jgi:4-aminobutyrate aminotransferase-like enzyme
VAGIGRYNEARAGDILNPLKVVTEEMPEARTMHLGLDLFVPEGSPVYAPADGVVYDLASSLVHNDFRTMVLLEHRVAGNTVSFYTLYGNVSAESISALQIGASVRQGEPFAFVGNPPAGYKQSPHLHFQIVVDEQAAGEDIQGAAAPGQRALWTSLCPDPNLILQIPESAFPKTGRNNEELLAARRQRLGRSLSISYQRPLKIVRGWRQYLYDDEGRAYLDVVNNVCHVGHCHPRVVAAGQAQMAVLNTNTRYLHDNIIEYARRLAATFPEPLRVCFFVNSGSEANDLALRLARNYTGHTGAIVLGAAYHGNLTSLIEISPYKHDGPGGKGAPPHVHKVLMPDSYRGPYKGMGAETGARYASHVRTAVEQSRRQGCGVAAFIAESLLGCGGQIVLPDAYLAEAYRHVRAAGGICIADEVQVGFGRAGSHMWGFETQGVVPDIVTLGKPIGNGHPLGAVVTTPEIADAFANGMEYFNTFGGNPVSCAIGLAVLDVIEEEGLQAHALRVGGRLMSGLRGLMEQYSLIGDVRGLGLFIGVELVLDRQTLEPAGEHASYIAERMRDHGILISTDGPFHNVLKLKPPLVFDEADANRLVATLAEILDEDPIRS